MTISCGETHSRLTALLDGELGEDEAEAVRRHIEVCAACAHSGSEALTLRGAVVAQSEEMADLWGAVIARIATTEMGQMSKELSLLRGVVVDLGRELAALRNELPARPASPLPRSTPLSFPDAPGPARKQYRLV